MSPPRTGIIARLRSRGAIETIAAAAFFAAITAWFLWPSIVGGQTLSVISGHSSSQFPWLATPQVGGDAAQSDQANGLYPNQVDAKRELDAGSYPLWSQYSYGGAPTMGTYYSMLPYPPRLAATLLLSPIRVHDFILLLHMWLAGMALYLLARWLGASFLGATFAGAMWMLSPSWWGLAILETNPPLAALLPLTLWLTLRAARSDRRRDMGLAILALGVTPLGATVQYGSILFVMNALVFVLWSLHRTGQLGCDLRTRLWIAASRSGLLLGVAGAISAVVIFPTAAAVSDSGRQQLENIATATSDVGLDDFRRIFSPALPEVIDGTTIWTLTFLGGAGAVLAILGLLFGRGSGAWLGRGITLTGFLVMVGTPLTAVAQAVVPGMSFVSPAGRLLPFFSFGAALLAAFGMDRARELAEAFSDREPFGMKEREVYAAVAVAVAAVFAFEISQSADYSRGVNQPFQPRTPDKLFPRTPMISALEAQRGEIAARGDQLRIVPVGNPVPPNQWSPYAFVGETHRLYGFEAITGYMNAVPRRSRAVAMMVEGKSPEVALRPQFGAYQSLVRIDVASLRVAQRAGVNAIVGPNDLTVNPKIARKIGAVGGRVTFTGIDGTIVALPQASPRASVVGGVERVDSDLAAAQRFSSAGFDPSTSMIVESGAAPAKPAAISSKVRFLPTGPNSRKLKVESSAAGWLVLLDSWSKGWTAKVDGVNQPILRANFNYRAVKVPKGASTVEMSYMPPGLWQGTVVTIIGILLTAGLLLLPNGPIGRERATI